MPKLVLKAQKGIYTSMRTLMATQVKLDSDYSSGRKSKASMEPKKDRSTIMVISVAKKVSMIAEMEIVVRKM